MANDIRCTFNTGSHTKNILTVQAELSLKFFVTYRLHHFQNKDPGTVGFL